jgi:hypothetical protein
MHPSSNAELHCARCNGAAGLPHRALLTIITRGHTNGGHQSTAPNNVHDTQTDTRAASCPHRALLSILTLGRTGGGGTGSTLLVYIMLTIRQQTHKQQLLTARCCPTLRSAALAAAITTQHL